MELTFWTYEGPPHVGAIRIANSMRGVHLLLHSPQGDTYADLLFTMIERDRKRPPVTYTTFQARDLGSDTAELVTSTLQSTVDRFRPSVLLVGDSCTAELIQDQPGTLATGAGLDVPVIPLEMLAYSRKENWGASETFYSLVRGLLNRQAPEPGWTRPARPEGQRPKVNLLGPTSLGFRCRDDIIEVRKLLESVGVDVGVVAPLGASPQDLLRIPEADANLCLYPEVADATCAWLQRTFKQPTISTVPIGVGATGDFLQELAETLGLTGCEVTADAVCRLPWYSRSVDSTYLTGKRVFIFGDATHALAAARMAREEMGFEVVGLGTYAREQARAVRKAAKDYGLEALITDNYLEVEKAVAELQPELVLVTQMERHIAKKLGIGCAVISTPAHVQDYPARYSPQMGFEGANVIFDTWVHPLVMGLEEHLLTMFREDFEFNDDKVPSHLAAVGGTSHRPAEAPAAESAEDAALRWDADAEKELKKIPFFVRGKARRNTEKYAMERGVAAINVETLYEAKAHFSR
ncbi:ferredoxin:protochlorophyllide reductase (ATP-dependent) subunit B [Pseudohaliea sp.]|uniref:ferredoxin:protochlorophyllide reductase (ATP-dependent) subunit B n=1 Tax=Pseudohaliea sp. TaxID=2740289 RepID=UPI0032EE85CD